jgi:gamma-butyrobetaine dioxygenase
MPTNLAARELAYPPVWLRDNCPCAACRDPRNGQKLFGVNDLPSAVSVLDVVESAGTVAVTFGPDGHRGEFSRAWLDAQGDADPGDHRSEQGKRLWSPRDLEDGLPTAAWAGYRADDAEKARVLRAVRDIGFAILSGTPVAEDTVLGIAATFGHVRETNYGRLFDVRVEANPNNLAFTGMAIAPHTDNPYRDPVPTLQLLHCLDNAVDGGESGLLDGFHAAALLRDEDAEAFRVLTTTLVPFAWSDATASLRADRPLIELDADGRIREVRFNNRSMQALRLPAARIDAFYRAYRSFAAVIARPELLLTFRLDAGDCVIFDNTRLLHARTAFAESGSRHLQGCYADLDALTSTLRVLEARP